MVNTGEDEQVLADDVEVPIISRNFDLYHIKSFELTASFGQCKNIAYRECNTLDCKNLNYDYSK